MFWWEGVRKEKVYMMDGEVVENVLIGGVVGVIWCGGSCEGMM